MKLEDLVIDPEFKAVFDRYAHEPWQLEGMEAGILKRGYGGERIEHWHGAICDGFTRHAIWLKHKDDSDHPEPELYDVSHIPTKAEVIKYMEDKQTHRRNLPPEALAYYRGRLARETIPQSNEGQPEGHVHNNGKAPPKRKVRKGQAALAKRLKVHRVTLHRDEKFAEAVDSLEQRGVAKKAELLSGEVGMEKVVAASQQTTKSGARQVLDSGKKPVPDEKMEIAKRFAAPLRMLAALNRDFPNPRFAAIETEVRRWCDAACGK